MGKVRHSASAETDLLEAWLYVAEGNIEAADRIDGEAHTLLTQPKMGRARDELAAGLRSWPTSTPYILFYFADADGITIARVLHHARDVPAIGLLTANPENACDGSTGMPSSAPLFSLRDRFVLRALAATLTLTLCAVPTAQAAAALENDFLGDQPVVLSVSRMAQPLDEAPGAVTVIDRDMIRRSGARELTDVLRLVPGFIVSHLEGGARPIVSYHADYDAITRHLQVFIDGRSVFSSLLVGTANNGLMAIVLDDIERIEVMRGSNSASFGANAFLGVVNIVTRHAQDVRGTHAAVGAGEDGVRDGTVRYGWGDDAQAHRLTLSRRADSGFDNVYDDKLIEQAHLRSDLRLSARDDLMVAAGHTRYAWGQVGRPLHDESWSNSYANVQWSRHLDATDKLRVGLIYDEERYTDFYPRLRADGVGRRIDLEAQHNFSLGNHWRFAWGGQYRHEQVVSADLFADAADQRFHLWRTFGSAEWKPHAQWVFNVGAMWEKHSIVGPVTAPRLMAHYHVVPGHSLRLGATRSYKQPTLFELRADWRLDNQPQLLALGGAEAERIDAIEAGYLGEIRPLNLSIDLRVFREHVRDLLRYSKPCSGCPNDVVNKDPNRQTGWETQLRWRPTADTQVQASYLHLRLDVDPASTSGADVYRAPPYVGSLAWLQKLPNDFDLAVIYYVVDEMFYIRNSDRVPKRQQTDMRLARQFRLGDMHAEAALTVRAISGGHIDFVERGYPEVYLGRRAHATLRLDF